MAFGRRVSLKMKNGYLSVQENGNSLICYVPGSLKPFTVTPENKQLYLERFFYYHTMGVIA